MGRQAAGKKRKGRGKGKGNVKGNKVKKWREEIRSHLGLLRYF